MDVSKLTKDLSDGDLAALGDHIQEEIRSRKPKLTLDDITPNMSKEKSAEIRAEIERLLKGR